MYEKHVDFLIKYFLGLQHPRLSEGEIKVIVGEIVAGFEVLMKNPDISYNEWWDQMHLLWEDKYWDLIDDHILFLKTHTM